MSTTTTSKSFSDTGGVRSGVKSRLLAIIKEAAALGIRYTAGELVLKYRDRHPGTKARDGVSSAICDMEVEGRLRYATERPCTTSNQSAFEVSFVSDTPTHTPTQQEFIRRARDLHALYKSPMFGHMLGAGVAESFDGLALRVKLDHYVGFLSAKASQSPGAGQD